MEDCTEDECNNQIWTGYDWEPCLKCLARALEQQEEETRQELEAARTRRRNLKIFGAHVAIWFGLLYLGKTTANKQDAGLFLMMFLFYPLLIGPMLHIFYKKYILKEND